MDTYQSKFEESKFHDDIENGIDYLKSLYKLRRNDFLQLRNLIDGKANARVLSGFLASKGLSKPESFRFIDAANLR